jgi:hypothetical protein
MDWEVEALIFAGGLVALALIGWAGWTMAKSASRRHS